MCPSTKEGIVEKKKGKRSIRAPAGKESLQPESGVDCFQSRFSLGSQKGPSSARSKRETRGKEEEKTKHEQEKEEKEFIDASVETFGIE